MAFEDGGACGESLRVRTYLAQKKNKFNKMAKYALFNFYDKGTVEISELSLVEGEIHLNDLSRTHRVNWSEKGVVTHCPARIVSMSGK